MTAAAFDRLAARYDAEWSESAVGLAQRRAVWQWIDPLFRYGDRVLDLGCGTGVDACHLTARGVHVDGLDASPEMVRLARARGVAANVLPLEEIHSLSGEYDGAISNFGVLNCLADFKPIVTSLARLIRPQGSLAICLMGPCCAWEIVYYLLHRKPGKAFRRWKRGGVLTSLGIRVTYPPVRRLATAFKPYFRLVRWCGIGLSIPPSYVRGLSDKAIERLAAIDRRIAHHPGVRALCDHRLLVFTRL